MRKEIETETRERARERKSNPNIELLCADDGDKSVIFCAFGLQFVISELRKKRMKS